MVKYSLKNYNRVRGGFIAKKRGAAFERAILIQARRYGIDVIDIPDGCEQRAAHLIIRVPTPFDYVLLRNGKAVFLDAKTEEGKTFSFSKIKPDQLDHLLRCASHGFRAGYLIHHRDLDRVYFYGAEVMRAIRPGSALRPEMGLDLGMVSDFDVRVLFDAP